MKVDWEELRRINKPYFESLKNILNEVEDECHYILGSHVSKFEKEIASYLNVKYCVAVGSGLDALTLSLRSLNLPPKSEVIVPSNTFYASVIAIINAGLTPVLCEPDKKYFNITSDNIESLITNKTSAILLVHLYGNPCEMDKICSLAQKYNLKIVEDCAQAFGAEYNDKKVGTFGNVGAFSFYSTKNLGGIGDGGLIATNDNKIYDYCMKARSYGGKDYKYDIIGMNSRMDEIVATFLLAKLKDIDELNNKKINNATMYLNHIKNKHVILPSVTENAKSVFHIFCLRVKNRDEFRKYLQDNGVYTYIHYPIPLCKQESLKDYIHDEYPISEELSNTVISIPCSAGHFKDEIEYVIDIINKYEG